MKTIITILLLSFSLALSAQIQITEEGNVSRMMTDFLDINKENETQKAWKIQITTTNDRRAMETSITKFNKYFPEYETNWSHENPYYKVKVGAWETKQDLYSFLLEVKQHFPSAIPVVDDIKKSELIKP